MKAPSLAILAIAFGALTALGVERENGFYSIRQYMAADPGVMSHIEQESLDDLFDTRSAAEAIASATRVRLFRQKKEMEEEREIESIEDRYSAYHLFERKRALKDRLSKSLPTVEVSEAAFRPVLKLASDFENYGDRTICVFDPGVALLIGGEEPQFILVCCFTCHDIHVVRRPTADHPMPQVAEVGMSPELERAILDLARAAYPEDKDLQSFKLRERKRGTTPLKKSPLFNNDSEAPAK